jgi:hypothetical protein
VPERNKRREWQCNWPERCASTVLAGRPVGWLRKQHNGMHCNRTYGPLIKSRIKVILQGFDRSTVSPFFHEFRRLRPGYRFYGVCRVCDFYPLYHKLSQRRPADFQSARGATTGPGTPRGERLAAAGLGVRLGEAHTRRHLSRRLSLRLKRA